LEAIAGVGASLAFPLFVLCTVGGLAALIGLVIAKEGLAGPEAAELLAEGEETCQALSSKTLEGITYVVGALQIGLRCEVMAYGARNLFRGVGFLLLFFYFVFHKFFHPDHGRYGPWFCIGVLALLLISIGFLRDWLASRMRR
jgi:hypothetical protein